MDWLLKHSVIKQYLQTNFKQREFKKAVKYTLIIGIQTLYQLHGNPAVHPFESFTLEQLSAMIISNDGALRVQADLPALSKCLKDIKTQLGSIHQELAETQPAAARARPPTATQTEKFVRNLVESKPHSVAAAEPTQLIEAKRAEAANPKVSKKADSKWRDGDSPKTKPSGVYPEWWPEDDAEDNSDRQRQETHDRPNQESEAQPLSNHIEHRPPVEPPNVYKQPVAFSVPTAQLKDENVVQLQVNLYPEYLQKCLGPDAIHKVNNPEDSEHETERPPNHRRTTQSKHRGSASKAAKRGKNRSKSLTRCTESSQAKSSGVRPQSAFLKSAGRDTAPCLKFQRASRPQSSHRVRDSNSDRENRRKSLPNKSRTAVTARKPKYLRNVKSRIRGELRRDRLRTQAIQSEKKSLIRDIARYGLDDDKNDIDAEEWSERFGYSRIRRDEVTKATALSVADAMMESDLIQAMDPSINKQPALVTERASFIDIDGPEQGAQQQPLYDRIRESAFKNGDDAASMANVSLVADLRKWAFGQSDCPDTASVDTDNAT